MKFSKYLFILAPQLDGSLSDQMANMWVILYMVQIFVMSDDEIVSKKENIYNSETCPIYSLLCLECI